MKARQWMRDACAVVVCLLLFAGTESSGVAAGKSAVPPTTFAQFQTPVTADNLDATAYTILEDGHERPAPGKVSDALWTQTTPPQWYGLTFGDGKTLGARAVRYGFKTAIPVGCVLVRGTVTVSILKASAVYPGRMANDTDWVPAHRLIGRSESTHESGGEEYTLWVLPPETRTRVLRFVHTPTPTDNSYAGTLSGAFVFSTRLANIAPQAVANASANDEQANLINNESTDGTWNTWDNTHREDRVRPPISREHPETVTLTWRQPVRLRGLCTIGTGFSAGQIEALIPRADPAEPRPYDWQIIASFKGLSSGYPLGLAPNSFDFGETITTRAVRIRMTQTIAENVHPHLKGTTADGRRVWLGELMALAPLGEAPVASAVLPAPTTAMPTPPIPVRFTLTAPGYVTLVIEDTAGKRVRNLIANTYFDHAGPNVAWWDGLDDLGRDTDAARHGVYHVPGKLVAPGTYQVRGLVHPRIDLRYQLSVYSGNGNPPWETADHTGGWTTNHTPPQSVLFVPPVNSSDKAHVLIGSYIAEGGDGLAIVDLTGRKTGGEGHIGGSWTGAPFLARDAGEHADADVSAYVGAAWNTDGDASKGELRLNAITPNGDRSVLTYQFAPTQRQGQNLPEGRSNDLPSELDGLAVRNGLLVAALRLQNKLLFVDTRLHQAIGSAPMDDPRGLAFDAEGRLLVLSGKTLRRCVVPQTLEAATLLNQPNWTASASVHPDDAQKALGGNLDARWSTLDWQAPGQWFSVDMKAATTFSTVVLTVRPDGDSPREYEVYVSANGVDWGEPIATGVGTPGVTRIAFAPVTARYLKIVQTGAAKDAYWSINRLDLYLASPLLMAAPTEQTLGETKTLVEGLEDPQGIALDRVGNLYVSDRGQSHQVKVFSSQGTFVRAIGHPGAPTVGPYDPLHMNNPQGVTVDSNGHLWVAEADFEPKRVSIWTLDGKLLKAFYGPSRYGGGGTLDPRDRTRFYYDGMEFKIDWATGESQPVDVFYRPDSDAFISPQAFIANGPPELPLYWQGRQYMTNCYNSNATNGVTVATLWRLQNGVAVPTAALGRANDWALLKRDAYRSRWPSGVDPNGDYGANQCLFVWSDLNGDGKVDPNEVEMQKAGTGGVTVQPDLSMVESRVGDHIVRFAPMRYTAGGTPVYSLTAGQTLARGAQSPASSGGDQVLIGSDGSLVTYPPTLPYSPFSLGGSKKDGATWSYPNPWPGLHASHESPSADRPGEVVGATRLLGGFVTPRHSDAGQLFALNGNMGNIYLFTADGLFIADLFQDVRVGKSWAMPTVRRDMLLNDVSLHDENFFPSIAQTLDGRIYLVDGGRSSLVRVDGLDAIRRVSTTSLHVSAADIARAQAYGVQAEVARQAGLVREPLHIARRAAPPTLDGDLADWVSVDWASIDKRGVSAWFNSNSHPYDIRAAVCIAGDRLYAAYRTGDPDLLRNMAKEPRSVFKFGGGLDLMLDAMPGGERLIVTQVKGKTLAMLYRTHVPGTREPVAFSSPTRTITIDRVDDVSDQVHLMVDGKGDFEFSIPLAALGLSPQPGQSVRGDIGILRGDGFQTLQRAYWSNKATGITADVPSEAELTPQLWGTWVFP